MSSLSPEPAPFTLPTLTAFGLACDADCASPDSSESAGATFLLGIRDAVHEMLSDVSDVDDEDELDSWSHPAADGAVPIYTHALWSTFTDLAAYNEDPSELGASGSDMTQAAQTCLYMIADRLVRTLVDEYRDEYRVNVDEDEDEDEDEDVDVDEDDETPEQDPSVWTHDESRDGAGCSYCGSFAMVDADCMCRECFEQDYRETLYGRLSPETRERLVVGGHDPLWLAQSDVDDEDDRETLRLISARERAEDERAGNERTDSK